ncbi:MAG: EF-hand domain-containing protein [Deltaproteobacteria bacterium]|nr:EF-hand domain-containing protein [Deltaproteobacteria bacterium]
MTGIAATGGMRGPEAGRLDPKDLFKKIDANGDGKIDEDELSAEISEAASRHGSASAVVDVASLMSDMDTDGDGSLGEDEYASGVKTFLNAVRGSAGGSPPMGSPPMGPPPDAAQLFSDADEDEDGTVTQDELANALAALGEKPEGAPDAAELFERLDANGDGKIDRDEFESEMEKLRNEKAEDYRKNIKIETTAATISLKV